MSNYRIVTNGIEFTIEVRRRAFWTGREYWQNIGDFNEFEAHEYFKTREDAQIRVNYLDKMDARTGEWRPV